MRILILLSTGTALCLAQEFARIELTQDNTQPRLMRPIASSGNVRTGQYTRGGQPQQPLYPVHPEHPYSQPGYPQAPAPPPPEQPYYPEPQQPYGRPDEVDAIDLFPNPSQPEEELPEFSVVQPPAWTAGTPPPPPEPYRPPPTEYVTPPPAPVETTTEKVGYEINFCDKREFPEATLDSYNLKKLDYFIYNASCNQVFFQCSIGQTFMLKCPSTDEAFDVATSNCNFRNSIKYCPEYDHVIHCTIADQCSPDEFACCSLPQKCLPLTKRCDGHQDCSDGDDENNCPSCQRDEFACVKSGRCILATQRCDGNHDDCQDGTNMDEIGCSKNSTCVGKFMCHQSFEGPSCIDYTMHCDGTKDCDNGEDEINCKVSEAKYLLCENQKQQVLRSNWCDGEEHCADGSDEKYCY